MSILRPSVSPTIVGGAAALLLFVFAVNALGSNLSLIIAGTILSTLLLVLILSPYVQDNGLYPKTLPASLAALGLLVFHFTWGANYSSEWYSRVVPEEYVIYALLTVTFAALAVTVGTVLAQSVRPHKCIKFDEFDYAQMLTVSTVFVIVGWLARYWSLTHGYVGFEVSSFGFDSLALSGPFDTIIMGAQNFVGVGETTILFVVLHYRTTSQTAVSTASSPRLFLLLFFCSFCFDVLFTAQSAAKAAIPIVLLPILLTLLIFGYRRLVFTLVCIGLVLYFFLFFPLFNSLRYDSDYKATVRNGQMYFLAPEYVMNAWSVESYNITDGLLRLNQTSLVAFSLQRLSQGLPELDGTSYQFALATLIPRLFSLYRKDVQVPYDDYTGYSVAFHGYNNWGLHTEALLNFGLVGVGLVMLIVGFLWQVTYSWLVGSRQVLGWGIAACLLLPSIFRAGEYGFLQTVPSTSKVIALAVVMSYIVSRIVRFIIPTRRLSSLH